MEFGDRCEGDFNDYQRMKTILITGGTGFIGKYLTKKLIQKGYQVKILSRKKHENTDNIKYFRWDFLNKKIPKEAFENTQAIIHLAGENIAKKRWTKKRKEKLKNSRIAPIHLIYEHLKKHKNQVKTFISASGIGFYGLKISNQIFLESDLSGADFLAKLCVKWEKESLKIEKLGIRRIILRTGLVFAKKNSALQKIALPYFWGFGMAIGSGKQYINWIHLEDLCRMYIFALEQKNITGIYNAVAPFPIKHTDFGKKLAKKMKRPFWNCKIPSFVLKIILGEMAEILLGGSAVSCEKIENEGFYFNTKLPIF